MTSTKPDPRPLGIPFVVMAWGLAGLIPFLGLPVLAILVPGLSTWTDQALALYAAVILSFLGGARWGREVGSAMPDARLIAMSMAPSVAAWGLILLPEAWAGLKLPGLALALILHLAWDFGAKGLPPWYPRLRLILTAGAVLGLALGAFV